LLRKRARDYGLAPTGLPPGPLNAITDVPGVRVGQVSVVSGTDARTGVTVIWPHDGNPFRERVFAATHVLNGYGIMTGRAVIAEWGVLGSPVVLVDTRSVGIAYEAVVQYFTELDPAVGDLDVMMPVVAECDDGYLNDNRRRHITVEDVRRALAEVRGGPVEEGNVGAGTGTQLFGFKGGIGTASRVVEIHGRTYTVGVLVNTNFGTRHQLQVRGVPLGRLITDLMPDHEKEGSCIAVLATDAPLDPLQLGRLAKRIGFGLVRTGSVGNDGSGEIFLAFSTAHRVPREVAAPLEVRRLVDGQFWTLGAPIDLLFDATAEATEEAVLNALVAAETMVGRDGHVLHAFPVERALELMKAYRGG
jgi:D-aminopeptidase